MTTELRHTPDGLMLCRLQAAGWQILQNPLGGGHFDSRCTGGWWLYKGDEAVARAEQAKQWANIKQRIDAYHDF
jgi:hypothetical protein